ncbi:MAG: polyhydroxyalkanoic acid system family protein [Hyphomonadaceae bacterium]
MATPITVTIPHQLGKDEARARLVAGFDQLKDQIAGAKVAQFQQVWAGDQLSFSARAMGQGISGRIDVQDRQIRIEVDLPAFLAGLAGRISGRLKERGRLLLEKK